LAAAITRAVPQAEIELVPGGRGEFTVTAGDQTLWSKFDRGGFPDENKLAQQIEKLGNP
jgi:selT/selW/selH-like putative selenoprotein